MSKYIVDRFDGHYAICENEAKEFISINMDLLPPEIKEGDCLCFDGNGVYYIDYELTKERKKSIRKKLDSLFE